MAPRYPLIASALLFAAIGQAQMQNALDFDGTNDKVTIPAASSLITGGTGISLACWVYPRNAAPAYPDFDGFAGMRNEFDADFYLLQTSPSDNIEARFRNSAGEVFTLEASGLELNTWQFLVFTYDGSQLTVYNDGVNVATAPASGSIVNDAVDMYIGNVYYQGTDFLLNGRVDEVSLWDRALSQSEIDCIYANDVDVTSDGLQLYYKMDQGIANGSNSGINSLIDGQGNIDGNLSGFALSGTTSNFVAGPPVGNSISATLCQGGSYEFNGQALSEAGVYSAAYDIGEPCDSLVTLTLNVTTVDTTVVQVGETMTSLVALGPWQWLDCDNGYAAVPGATQQHFTATSNGSYALMVTQNGCTDTSSCHTVTTAGITELGQALHASVFPDPAMDRVRIGLGHSVPQVSLSVCDMNGREWLRKAYGNTASLDLSIADLAPGMYIVHLRSPEGNGVYRLVKE
jgi:hypothetical protein